MKPVMGVGVGAAAAIAMVIAVATSGTGADGAPFDPRNCETGFVVGTVADYGMEPDTRTPDEIAEDWRSRAVPGGQAKTKKEKKDKGSATEKYYDYYDGNGKTVGTVKLEKHGSSWRMMAADGCSDVAGPAGEQP